MRRADATSTRWPLWFALLAGPTAWTFHELLSYVFVKIACETGLGLLEHVVTICALALAGAGMYVAVRAYGHETAAAQDTSGFVAGAAVLINALFAFAILMEAIPNALVNPCL